MQRGRAQGIGPFQLPPYAVEQTGLEHLPWSPHRYDQPWLDDPKTVTVALTESAHPPLQAAVTTQGGTPIASE